MSLMTLTLAVFDMSAAVVAVSTACELGHRLTSVFDRIGDEFIKFNWYQFPIEMNRMLPMILANTQKPVVLECFGSITCNREVFKSVSSNSVNQWIIVYVLIINPIFLDGQQNILVLHDSSWSYQIKQHISEI